MKFKKLFLFVMILCIAISAISAADNDTFSSIQYEIDHADNGAIIYLNESYYAPDSDAKEISIIDKNITIDGSSRGSGSSTIDGNNTILIFAIKNSSVTFLNLNLINGNSSSNGGAINAVNSTVIIDNCIFSDNSAANGGAIYSNSVLNITNSSFDDNSASNYGSAIFNNGNMSIKDSHFLDNNKNFATIYISGDNTTEIFFDSNEIESKSTPIYNDGAIIVSPTTLTILENSTKNYNVGDAPQINANLCDDNNNTIGSKNPINLNIVGINDTIPATFNANSQSYLTEKVNLENAGEFPVTGNYDQATDLTLLNGILNITTIPTTVTININDKKYGEEIKGEITVTDANGNKITSPANVSIIINNWNDTVPIVNGNGQFIIDGVLNCGNYTAYVVFDGNNKYDSSKNNTTFTISLLKPNMEITAKNEGNNIVIDVTLPENIYDVVDVVVDNKTYSVEINEGKGQLIIPNINKKSFDIIALFQGNENYLPTNVTVVFENNNNSTNPNSTNNSSNSNNANELINKQSDLETGNPIALLLLALFIIPVRRALKK